jgi:nucleoside-diphosphate-sugar epimerase
VRILILGGDGYLGWPTAMRLAAKDHDVCVVDNYLHYFFPDEATVARKKAFREGIGKVEFEPHPLQSFGSLESLPVWAKI